MLVIGKADMAEAVSRQEILSEIESIMKFYETKDFIMPARWHLDFGENTLLLMPCFTKAAYGTKLISLIPGNPARNKAMINALMVLNDAETGEPLAVLEGGLLTALRTAAVGGVGVRHLSPPAPHTLGLIGAGVQGFQQACFACAAAEIEKVVVFDMNRDKVPDFLAGLGRVLTGVELSMALDVEDLLKQSTTIITATTSLAPVLPDNPDLLAGKHFVGIGSYKPNMREFPDSLFKMLDTLYIDTEHALEESGDVIDPLKYGWIGKDQVKTLGRFLLNRESPGEGTTLFKSVGMGLFDVGVAHLMYRRALEKNLGQTVEM